MRNMACVPQFQILRYLNGAGLPLQNQIQLKHRVMGMTPKLMSLRKMLTYTLSVFRLKIE